MKPALDRTKLSFGCSSLTSNIYIYIVSFIIIIIIIFFFWLLWVFVAARGLYLVAVSGGYASLWCVSFPLRWLLLPSTGSRHAGSRAQAG